MCVVCVAFQITSPSDLNKNSEMSMRVVLFCGSCKTNFGAVVFFNENFNESVDFIV